MRCEAAQYLHASLFVDVINDLNGFSKGTPLDQLYKLVDITFRSALFTGEELRRSVHEKAQLATLVKRAPAYKIVSDFEK